MITPPARSAGTVTDTGLSVRRPLWRPVVLLIVLACLWAWAIAGCLDEWRHNPMYSYGWFVPPLMLFFLWRRFDEPIAGRELIGAPRLPIRGGALAMAAGVLAILVLPLELLRNELPDDRLNNWLIALMAVGSTFLALYWAGGWRLVLTGAFPIAFFLTAVAWPKRFETPVTIGLQKFVATTIVEVLHVIGVHAEPHGTTIYLRQGPVGIAEACSGIRSLQASLMISLAIGELFFLRWVRRAALVLVCSAVATVLNLGRTLTLCLITEYNGAEAMHAAHDRLGDAILVGLPLVGWVLGWILARGGGALPTTPAARRPGPDGARPVPQWKRVWNQLANLDWRRVPNLGPALMIGVAGFLTYHAWLMVLDRRDPPQQEPFFTVITESGTSEEEMSPDIWAALSPTMGGTYTHHEPAVPGGRVHLYHFFWKPAAANRWVTGHRPDVCMPAGGWEQDGPVEPIEIELDGQRLRLHLFRFAGVGQRALQVWGIWRNGQPIQMEFFEKPTLEWSLLTGKSRSAVEVVSCVVPYLDGDPPVELAKEVLRDTVRYRRVISGPSHTRPSGDPHVAARKEMAPERAVQR
jgi:exosortase